jgi:hypothetical protein
VEERTKSKTTHVPTTVAPMPEVAAVPGTTNPAVCRAPFPASTQFIKRIPEGAEQSLVRWRADLECDAKNRNSSFQLCLKLNESANWTAAGVLRCETLADDGNESSERKEERDMAKIDPKSSSGDDDSANRGPESSPGDDGSANRDLESSSARDDESSPEFTTRVSLARNDC